MGFDDILDSLDFAGTVHFEGRQAKWGFLFDYSLIKLEEEPRGRDSTITRVP